MVYRFVHVVCKRRSQRRDKHETNRDGFHWRKRQVFDQMAERFDVILRWRGAFVEIVLVHF